MPFTVSYNITANDFFSKKIAEMGKKLDKFKEKLGNIGSGSIIEGVSNLVCKVMKDTKTINKSLSGLDDSVKTDKLSKFNRFLFSTGNIAASAAEKIRNMMPSHNIEKYVGKGSAGLALASGMIGSDEVSKARIRLLPLVGSMSKVTESINKMRMMSVKTGKSFKELSESYRLLLEGGFKEKRALKTLPSITGLSYYTGLPMTEFSNAYSKVMEGHGAGEAFRMLLKRGVNLYKPLYSMMHGGKKLSNLSTSEFPQQMQMLNAYVESRAFTLPKFQAVMDSYSNQYMKGMTKKYTENTFSGGLSKIASSFHQITTSMSIAISKTLYLHQAMAAVSNTMGALAQRFMKFSNSHPTVAATASIGVLSALSIASVRSIKKLWGAVKEGSTVLEKGSILFKEIFNEFSRFFGLFAKAGAFLSRFVSPVMTVGSFLSPVTAGDSTLKAYKKITKPEDIQRKLRQIYGDNENKSHVKIDVVAHGANVKAIKKHNIKGNSIFDVSALGQNQYRLST